MDKTYILNTDIVFTKIILFSSPSKKAKVALDWTLFCADMVVTILVSLFSEIFWVLGTFLCMCVFRSSRMYEASSSPGEQGWPGQGLDPSSDPSSFPPAGDAGNYSPDYWPHPAAAVGQVMNCKWLAPSAQLQTQINLQRVIMTGAGRRLAAITRQPVSPTYARLSRSIITCQAPR